MEEQKPVEILLIEDSFTDARLVQECFQESVIPNRVHVVSDGEDALDYLKQDGTFTDVARPDLILLDLNIPRVHGLTVLSAVKSDPELKKIPVIVITASAIEEDVHRAYDLQANSYMSKPTDLDGFIEMVRSIERHWLKHATLARSEVDDAASTMDE